VPALAISQGLANTSTWCSGPVGTSVRSFGESERARCVGDLVRARFEASAELLIARAQLGDPQPGRHALRGIIHPGPANGSCSSLAAADCRHERAKAQCDADGHPPDAGVALDWRPRSPGRAPAPAARARAPTLAMAPMRLSRREAQGSRHPGPANRRSAAVAPRSQHDRAQP